MSLPIETEAYQALLEGHRMDPDNEQLWEDLCKAKIAMEAAWLKHVTGTVQPTQMWFGDIVGGQFP